MIRHFTEEEIIDILTEKVRENDPAVKVVADRILLTEEEGLRIDLEIVFKDNRF